MQASHVRQLGLRLAKRFLGQFELGMLSPA